MTKTNFRIRRNGSNIIIESEDNDNSGSWNLYETFGYLSYAETKFLQLLKEEARMEELNSMATGREKSPYVMDLENRVKQLTADLEALRKLYE